MIEKYDIKELAILFLVVVVVLIIGYLTREEWEFTDAKGRTVHCSEMLGRAHCNVTEPK